ncbi:MAG: flagellar basal body rod protein FlgB [Pseudomonadota bacterium]|nr:flagellar basal body rod protein FlgB [Pseudomonadota bacterium]
MELSNLPIFGLMRQRMNWLNQRQEVIAQNIANADTPEYSSRDLKPFDFKSVVRGSRPKSNVSVMTTQPTHISGSKGMGNSSFKETNAKSPYETAPDGNQVVLEEQMIKMNETTTNHNLITQIYRKQLAMFRTVTRGGGR